MEHCTDRKREMRSFKLVVLNFLLSVSSQLRHLTNGTKQAVHFLPLLLYLKSINFFCVSVELHNLVGKFGRT